MTDKSKQYSILGAFGSPEDTIPNFKGVYNFVPTFSPLFFFFKKIATQRAHR